MRAQTAIRTLPPALVAAAALCAGCALVDPAAEHDPAPVNTPPAEAAMVQQELDHRADGAPAPPRAEPLPARESVVTLQRRSRSAPWQPGVVRVPRALFGSGAAADRGVLESNPRVYLHPDFDPEHPEPVVVVGLPGWGGRSENFVWTLINGVQRPELNRRLVVAAIQDTHTGGPRYQGQGSRAHANVWRTTGDSVDRLQHFVATLAGALGGRPRVYLVGYSTGGVAAPRLAARIADPGAPYRVAGAVALGTGTRATARELRDADLRVLFLVVPRRTDADPRPLRDDASNREQAERSQQRLSRAGAAAYLRHIDSARRHRDWHWGLISPCRFFPGDRVDEGRGYWPNYWMPNPETGAHITAFVLGDAPPRRAPDIAPTRCPY